jgi:hypothetical protein
MLTSGNSSPPAMMTVPVVSRPRRPALPAIWVYSPGSNVPMRNEVGSVSERGHYISTDNSRNEWPSCFRMPENTTLFAGMLTPCTWGKKGVTDSSASSQHPSGLAHHSKSFGGEQHFDQAPREEDFHDLCRNTAISAKSSPRNLLEDLIDPLRWEADHRDVHQCRGRGARASLRFEAASCPSLFTRLH